VLVSRCVSRDLSAVGSRFRAMFMTLPLELPDFAVGKERERRKKPLRKRGIEHAVHLKCARRFG
jgi:hypothetical protein